MKRSLLILLTAFFACTHLEASECACCQTLSLDGAGATASPTSLKLKWSQGEAETNKIDLLFVFDASARAWLAENGSAKEIFANQISQDMNCGISLTGLDAYFTFRLAGCYDLAADLSELSLPNVCSYASGATKKTSLEQYFMPMRTYRDEVAADIVIVLTAPQGGKSYGISVELTSEYLTSSKISTIAKFAYCAVDIRFAIERYSVLHEVGHVMGAGHSNTQKNSPGPQLNPYSSGYAFSTAHVQYVTVMGYPSGSEETGDYVERLPFFSSPDYLLDGVPVGTASKNDNTRTLRETYPLVANFRVKTYLPDFDPSDSAADDSASDGDPVSKEDIALTVSDASGEIIRNGDTIDLHQFENTEMSVFADCWTGEKATVKVKGLPLGMKYSSKTGKISGYPKKAGPFNVKATATAKGLEPSERTFVISVSALPDAIMGSYAGIISNAANGDALATATLGKTGKVSVKFILDGRVRTFSCYGFAGCADGRWTAEPSAKISKTAHSLRVVFDASARSISIAGYSGMLLQNVWGRKDVPVPVFKKAIQKEIGDFAVRLHGKGRVKISGIVEGKKVSGVFQIVAGSPENGFQEGQWSLPVAFPPKQKFSGWAGWFAVALAVDGSNRVTDAGIEK